MKLTRDNTLKHYNLYNNLPENKDKARQQAINYQKQDLLEDDRDGELEREYIPYIVNKALSFTPDTILQANEMNCKPFLDKKLQYHYLLNIIRKKNTIR